MTPMMVIASAMPASTTSWNCAATRGAGATEQGADEGAGQRDETGRAGLVEVRQQRLAHGLLPDLEVRAGRRRAQGQPRLDLVAAVPDTRRKLRPDSVAALMALPMMMPATATR